MRVEELTYEGIFLHEAPKEGETMKIKRVASVIKADSVEAALEEVKLDPYYNQGISDPSSVSFSLFYRHMQ
jgi:uncharacterized protein YciI